jgi:ATP-dependent Clp protease adaptor protein ClpS
MSTDNDVIEETKTKLKRPKKWVVILHNDDITPMDFVIELLSTVFRMDTAAAMSLMLMVHTQGKGVAGIYPFEVAEQKLAEAQAYVKLCHMSLQLSIEEE